MVSKISRLDACIVRRSVYMGMRILSCPWKCDTATCKINGNFQRISTDGLYQFTTGTPSERSCLFCKLQYHETLSWAWNSNVFMYDVQTSMHQQAEACKYIYIYVYIYTHTHTYIHTLNSYALTLDFAVYHNHRIKYMCVAKFFIFLCVCYACMHTAHMHLCIRA
jgi:hypothetical protein